MQALAQNVTVIPARRKRTGIQKERVEEPKTRVAAYCRVSTDSEEQETSYEAQVSHYTSHIKSNSKWEFAGVYADDGISGTNTRNREGFNKLIDDCKAGKVDLILTKSISRFSRNTVDCLKYTRMLKELNVAVYFEKENINTLDTKGEVLMTIMAALAQQESESLSANVRLGIQFRNQQGKVQVNHNWFLGYTKDSEGNLIINPEQAKIVKRIYREYLEGKSLVQIKRGLEKDGIRNGAGHKRWHESNIKQILTNEKYIGDALLQKTYTVDIFEKKRSANNGALPQYYVEGSQEAIIDKSIFLRVQAEMDRRANINSKGKRRVYSSKYALSSMVFCENCGDVFRRLTWNIRGRKEIVWKCVTRVEGGPNACSARVVKEADLHDAVVEAVNRLYRDKDSIVPVLEGNIQEVLLGETADRLQILNQKLESLQRELLDNIGNEREEERIGNLMMELKEEQHELMTKAALQEEVNERVRELTAYLNEMPKIITEYSDDIVRSLIDRVLVRESSLLILFKSGIEIEI